jgi:hypothetical protein
MSALVLLWPFLLPGALNSYRYGNIQSGTIFELLCDDKRRYAFYQQENATAHHELFPAPLHTVSKNLLLTAVLLTKMCGPPLTKGWSFSSHCRASLSSEMV